MLTLVKITMNFYHQRSRVQSHKKETTNQKILVYRSSIAIVRIINIYMWLHGIGYIEKLKRGFTNFSQLFLSFVLLFIFEGCTMYFIFDHLALMIENGKQNKESIFLLILPMIDWLLRILLYRKRKVFMFIAQKVFNKYCITFSHKVQKFCVALILIFMSNDVLDIIMYFYQSVVETGKLFGSHKNNYYFGMLRPTLSTIVYYLIMFVLYWTSMMSFVPIYFCSLCFALKNILRESRRKLVHEKNITLQHLFETYNETADLISYINHNIHSVLLSTFTVLLGSVFYYAYLIIFAESELASRQLHCYIYLVTYFTMFALMCLFASAVTNAAADFEDAILNQPIIRKNRDTDFRDVQFLLKIKGRFVGFMLLDSLVINKGLILAATGSLLTYGLMIATFNINSKQ